MRRGSKGQKNKKSELNSVEKEMTDSGNAGIDESGSENEVEMPSFAANRQSSRGQAKTNKEGKNSKKEIEKQENGKSLTRRRKKNVDYSVNSDSDFENNRPVNKKTKVMTDKEYNKNQDKNGKLSAKIKEKIKTNEKEAENGNSEEEYEVEKIVDQRTIKGRRQFLIRWKGYTEEEDTWEHEKDINCDKLIEEFLVEQEDIETEMEEKKKNKHESEKKDKIKNSKKGYKDKKDNTKNGEDKDVDDSKEYEVEKILDVRFKKNNKRHFLIRWKGFSVKDDSWEPEEHLNCPELINKFMQKLEKIKCQDTRELRTNPSHTNRYTLIMHGDKRQSRRNFNRER